MLHLGMKMLVIVSEVICMAGLSEIVCWDPIPGVRRSEGSPGEVPVQF